MSEELYFGSLKRKVTLQLDNVYNVLNTLLYGTTQEEKTNSLFTLKKLLQALVVDESSNIGKTEQEFVDLVGCIADSLKGVNGIVSSVQTMSNNAFPAKITINSYEFASPEILDLGYITLWNKFRDRDVPANLITVDNEKYVKGTNALFLVELAEKDTFGNVIQEPLYRDNFNVEPYLDDNKTVYFYPNKSFVVTDLEDESIELRYGVDYVINNLRTVVNGEEKPGMIYVYKNNDNVMCAKLIFDISYPAFDDETKGFPKNYFSIETILQCNDDLTPKTYSIRVINNIS